MTDLNQTKGQRPKIAETATYKSYAINVTARDIACGVRNNAESCPIARAAHRRFRTTVRVRGELLVDLGDTWMHGFDIPESAQNFMEDFDAGRPVVPFKFRVREL